MIERKLMHNNTTLTVLYQVRNLTVLFSIFIYLLTLLCFCLLPNLMPALKFYLR